MLHTINGFIEPAFKSVATIFKNQIIQRGGGAALCIYHNGEPIADIWAGTRNPLNEPWLKDTTAVSFSTTKGILAGILHMILEDAHLDYETQVQQIWPSFKQNNKGHITIRQLLCHEAGLFNLQHNIDHIHDIYDWDQMVWRMAKATPSFKHLGEPSYHAVTIGWLIGELIHRLTGQLPGEFLNHELRSVLGRNCFIGVPNKALTACAHITQHLEQSDVTQSIVKTIQNKANKKLSTLLFKGKSFTAALRPPTSELLNFNDTQFLQAQLPSMNGVFTARGLAQFYNGLIHTDNTKRLIPLERLTQIQDIQNTGRDRIIHIPMHWRLGYHRILNTKRSAPQGFGHYGYGGSGAWCDPSRHLAVGFVVNSLWCAPFGDYRMAQLSGEILKRIDQLKIDRH